MLIGYMRVSSESDRQSTDLQRDALLCAGVDHRHLFEDHASGAKEDRPGLARALEFVKTGDVLIVWKLDRLGRSLPHLLSIVNSLKSKQVAFRSLTEGMDTTTASGEMLFQIFGALAQYERAMTQERVVAGLAAAKRRGRVGGRPVAIDTEKLAAIMAALRGGMSKAAACRNFNVKRTTLIDTLARTALIEN
ncbi:recombinase family protein [Sulfuriferula nivalis]|uniref:TniR protein n=1 Tax=Sulfuriferula nivalis TaxID=2675298 RepID=A0A809SIT5_9PROT|nr:recombinase family protein [Sulfuriferula nivalis]BBP02450.1 TniR protein [Sulfuriferula nivalis]